MTVTMLASACGRSESPEPPLEATTVALSDSIIAPVLPGARLESEPENRLEIEVTYPQLNPSATPELAPIIDAINADIATRVSAQADSFLVSAREAAKRLGDQIETGHSSLEGRFFDPFLNDRVFSVREEVSNYVLGAAHPIHVITVFNYDLGTGNRLELEDLFDGSTAYLDTLSIRAGARLIADAEQRGLRAEGLFHAGFAQEAENFSLFTIGQDSLRLHFPAGSVAPGVAGPLTVSIPYGALRSVLQNTGPAATLASPTTTSPR